MPSYYFAITFRSLAEIIFSKTSRDIPETSRMPSILYLKNDMQNAHGDLEALVSTVNIFKLMEEFDKENNKYPMFKWARMYMRQVTDLLQFLRSRRARLWSLHLASLEHLCVSFFAYNRLDYALNIPEYKYQFQQTHPEVRNNFEIEAFSVKTYIHS